MKSLKLIKILCVAMFVVFAMNSLVMAQIYHTSNGNVGIGTTSPKEHLQIGNAIAFHDGGWKGLFFNLYFDNGGKRLNDGYSSQILFDTTEVHFE